MTIESKNVNLIDYFYVLVKWRKLIIINFMIVSVAAVIISILMPKWYQSTAVIMSPKSQSLGLDIASMVSKLPISGLGLPVGSTETQAFMAILKSRTIMEEIIRKYDLIRVYERKDIELTLKALAENVDVALGDEGQIVLSVLDRDPERAAAMASSLVSALDSIHTQLNVQKARNDRIFVEERLTKNKKDLKKAEEQLKTFQEEYGVVDVPEQTKAAIATAAEIQGIIYASEVELRTKEKYLAPNHDEIINLKRKLNELKKKLGELKFGVESANGGFANRDNLFVPFESVPNIGLEYIRLLREVEVQNKIFEFLTQMYEQAKIEEAKETPSLQVLDHPRVPLRKAKPKRAIIVIVAALFSLVLSSLYVFAKEFMNNVMIQNSQSSERMRWIRDQMKSDFNFFRKKSPE